MRYFLSRYVGAGTDRSSFRPAGADQAEALGAAWFSIDLRADPGRVAGWAVFSTEAAVSPGQGRIDLGRDLDAPLAPAARAALVAVGRPFSGATLRQILPDILLGIGLRPERRQRKAGVHVVHLGGLVWRQPVVAGGATYSDDFNRALLGANWTAVNGGWSIDANRLARSTFGSVEAAVRYGPALDTDDHYCQIDFVGQGASVNGYLGPAVRFDPSAATYYSGVARAGGALRWIQKRIGGTLTTLASDALGSGPPKTLRLDVSGSTLTLYVNGVVALTVTDASITGNLQVGVQAHPVSAGNVHGDNFLASDIAPVAMALKFDISPDDASEGGNHTATIHLNMVVDGVETDLGTVTSPPNTGIGGPADYIWEDRTVDVSGIFDPDADEVYVRWLWESGLDTGHVRLLRVERIIDGELWRDQYGDWAPLADSPTFDGGTPPGQKDPCDVAGAYIIDEYGDGHVRHLLLPPWDPAICNAGWVIGFVPIG